MTDQQYAYPFDPTGELNENLIVKERHIISPPDYTDFYFIVPEVGPFFEHNLVVQHWPTGRILVDGVDFVLSYKFLGASRATAKPVYGAISIYDREISGVLEITYHTLGGPWTINEAKAAELLSNAMNNPRSTTWEQVVELPHSFPVIDHEWDLVDMVGASELQDAIDRITDTLLDTGQGGTGESHASNRNNPHQVTKAQVGLGSVENYTVASFSEGTDPSVTNRYMTPQRTAQLISSYLGNTVASHIDNYENPHRVTQTQVGLSNVPNYRLASSSEAVDPLVDNRFVTPKRVHEAIQFVAIDALNIHESRIDNPHNVTKAQIGLDRVENYSIASDSVARDGTSQIHYLTPHGATQMLEAKVGSGVVEHIDARDNPHMVTKAQLGLGNVPNFAMASVSDAVSGADQDSFMSPYHTKLLIDSVVTTSNDALIDLVSDHTSNFNNPHRVTKSQVGLSLVQDYEMASQVDAIEGVRVDAYMSPKTSASLVDDRIVTAFTGFVAEDSSRLEGLSLEQVTELIAGTVSIYITELKNDVTILNQTVIDDRQDFDDHAQNVSNPHQVTKAQVGLSNVSNFTLATTLEAEEGLSDSAYMTPALVAAAIATQAGTRIDSHVTRVDNPHNVTKSQVGLGNVEDFKIATLPEALAGSIDDRYMTPSLVAAAIQKQSTDYLTAHVEDINNPHSVTKTQVGLGSVENFGVATAIEAEVGIVSNKYMTPETVTLAIEAQTPALIDVHANDDGNPHNVTKTQVGLSQVENYPVASSDQAIDKDNVSTYMTPSNAYTSFIKNFSDKMNTDIDPRFASVADDILAVSYDITNHTIREDNPHGVTKTQVGLGNVNDFPIATEIEATTGISTDRYMTPKNTRDAIVSVTDPLFLRQDGLRDDLRSDLIDEIAQTTSVISAHSSRTDNPHQVTIDQVGGLSEEQINAKLNLKLDAADGIAHDSTMFGGRTVSEYDSVIDDKISAVAQGLVDDVNNQFLLGGNDSGQVFYRKVSEAPFNYSEWTAMMSGVNFGLYSFNFMVLVEGIGIVVQTVTVSHDHNAEWTIEEVSLGSEIESMFGLVIDVDNRRIEIWQKVPNQCKAAQGAVDIVNPIFKIVTDSVESPLPPDNIIMSDDRSIGFSYRLAKAIEDEIGLVIQTLDS